MTARLPLEARPAVLDLIGNPLLLPVQRLDTGPCQLFLKLESQNPGGSIKDRIGLAMIETAEREGVLKHGGGMISVALKTDLAGARRFLQRVELFTLAESLISLPALMTHASIPPETRARLGITDSLVRLSVGIEAADDLRRDLAAALAVI